MSALDLTAVDQDLIVARGQYATVREARENAVKLLHKTATDIAGIPQSVLRYAQDGQSVKPDIDRLRKLLDTFEKEADSVIALQQQKEALKPAAWGKTSISKE